MLPTTNQRKLLTLANIFILGYAIISIWRIITTGAPDFSVFYESAANLARGVNVYHDRSLYTGLGYPPVTLLLFIPLTYLPYQLAQGIWVVGSLAAFGATITLSLKLARALTWDHLLVAFPFLFLSFPTRFTLGMGQVNFYALFFLLLSLYLIKRKRWWSGVCLTIVLLLKPHLVIILPVFLLAGEWRIVAGVTIGYCLIIAITGISFGWFQFLSYIHEVLPPLLAFRGREIYYNQGLGGFFARLSLPTAQWLTLATSLSLFLVTIFMLYKKPASLVTGVGIFLPVFLLTEPLAWQHHFVFLFPSFIWGWQLIKNGLEKALMLLAYSLISVNIKSPEQLAGMAVGGLVLSHVFFGTIIVYILYLGVIFRRKSG